MVMGRLSTRRQNFNPVSRWNSVEIRSESKLFFQTSSTLIVIDTPWWKICFWMYLMVKKEDVLDLKKNHDKKMCQWRPHFIFGFSKSKRTLFSVWKHSKTSFKEYQWRSKSMRFGKMTCCQTGFLHFASGWPDQSLALVRMIVHPTFWLHCACTITLCLWKKFSSLKLKRAYNLTVLYTVFSFSHGF